MSRLYRYLAASARSRSQLSIAFVKRLELRSKTFDKIRNMDLLHSWESNGSALPGGYLFIERGLLEQTEDEAQRAGVIAHDRRFQNQGLFTLLGQTQQKPVYWLSGIRRRGWADAYNG